jgi:hypothetical protein
MVSLAQPISSPGHRMRSSHSFDVCEQYNCSLDASKHAMTKKSRLAAGFRLVLMTRSMHMPVFFLFCGGIS